VEHLLSHSHLPACFLHPNLSADGGIAAVQQGGATRERDDKPVRKKRVLASYNDVSRYQGPPDLVSI
jgi:hypothetical protein